MVVVEDSTRILERRRLSFGLVDVHTAQLHPIIGMPVLVPVPKNVIFNWGKITQQIYFIKRSNLKLHGRLLLFAYDRSI